MMINMNCEYESDYLFEVVTVLDCLSAAYDLSLSLKPIFTSTALFFLKHSIFPIERKNSLLLALYIFVNKIPWTLVITSVVAVGSIPSTALLKCCSNSASDTTLSLVT